MYNDNIVDSFDYKGYKINIHQDYDSPYWIDDENLESDTQFIISWHRDFYVKNEGSGLNLDQDTCFQLINKDYDDDEKEYYSEIERKYYYFLIEAYIHGGVKLYLVENNENIPDRRWDVSVVGLVFISKEQAKNRADAKKQAEQYIKLYNDYLNGNVYGYTTEPKTDSVWGFVGDYNDDDTIILDAKREIDHDISKKTKALKSKIKAKAPYFARQGIIPSK